MQAMEDSLPLIEAKGIDHAYVYRVGNPYISYAMADMLFTAMQTPADTFVFLDDDLSWDPPALLKLLETSGDVCAGTYRFKHEKEEYMGSWHYGRDNRPSLRTADGAIYAKMVPSGFLKLSRQAVRTFMKGYPNLIFGDPEKPGVDLFNHGATFPGDGRWWGQDYAFCKRYSDIGGQIWIVPDLTINHHLWDSDTVFRGNLHEFLLREPGGSLAQPEVTNQFKVSAA